MLSYTPSCVLPRLGSSLSMSASDQPSTGARPRLPSRLKIHLIPSVIPRKRCPHLPGQRTPSGCGSCLRILREGSTVRRLPTVGGADTRQVVQARSFLYHGMSIRCTSPSSVLRLYKVLLVITTKLLAFGGCKSHIRRYGEGFPYTPSLTPPLF